MAEDDAENDMAAPVGADRRAELEALMVLLAHIAAIADDAGAKDAAWFATLAREALALEIADGCAQGHHQPRCGARH